MKLSAVVITKNEEGKIRACLESIKWADEIIVVDNGSTDSTLNIVKKYTNNILTFKDQDFANLRNKGMEKAQGEWVLYIDSDERILQPLKIEIQQMMESGKYSAFAISRRNIIFGKEVNYGPYKKDWVIRLIKKSTFKTWVGKVHEYATFEGELGYTKNSLLHLTHRDVDQVVLKSLEWSKIDAKLRIEAGHPNMSGWRFLRILFGEIFYQGVAKGGFFSGTVGVMDSILQTFSFFITYVRLWQLQQPRQMDQIYDAIDQKLIENNFKEV